MILSVLSDILMYLLDVILHTLTQLLILFGPLFLLALASQIISSRAERAGVSVFGLRGYLWIFAWFGTAVHELGHLIFAVIFRHKIVEVKLFSPDPETGNLGYVKHSWRENNIYQSAGNFFIGIGPILLGTFVLYLLMKLLFGIDSQLITTDYFTKESFSDFVIFTDTLLSIIQGVGSYFAAIFKSPNNHWWEWLIFIYLAYGIGSSITLSVQDLKGSFTGFILLVVILLIFNLITLWSGDYGTSIFYRVNNFFSGFYFLMVIVLTLNLAFLIVLTIIQKILK